MNPRPLKELLQILLDEVERNGVVLGLCNLNSELHFDKKICYEDFRKIKEFINSKQTHSFLYLFPKGESQPRIEFLKNEIEKLT